MPTQHLPLAKIIVDAGTQMRGLNSEATIAEYAEELRQGCVFPAIIVFTDGMFYWLADGFHRFEAHARCGIEVILCDIREGTLVDAKKFACEANAAHGLRRSSDAKRFAVKEYLQLPEAAQMSNHAIGMKLRVSHHLVQDVRTNTDAPPSPKSHVGKGAGKKRQSPDAKPVSSGKSKGFTNIYNVSVDKPEQFVSILRAQFEKPYLHSLQALLQRSLTDE